MGARKSVVLVTGIGAASYNTPPHRAPNTPACSGPRFLDHLIA